MSVPPISAAAGRLRVQVLSEAETGLIAAIEPSPPEAASPKPTAAAANPLVKAVAEARVTAAADQAGAAALFADLGRAADLETLPPSVRAAIVQVLALRLPAAAIAGPMLRQAFAQSGLFLEANLAAGPAEPPPDLKGALLGLRAALADIPSREAPPKAPAAIPPPLRQAALAGQPPATPTLPAEADTPTLTAHLRAEVEQALARQTLHQLASLDDTRPPAWMFELPIATPRGTAVAQFEIERDAKGSDAEADAPVWRARFCLDVEPLGPVHVHLSLARGRTAAAIWAERQETLQRLQPGGERLARELSAEIAFHAGAPASPLPPPGRFLDRAS